MVRALHASVEGLRRPWYFLGTGGNSVSSLRKTFYLFLSLPFEASPPVPKSSSDRMSTARKDAHYD
jgi:hypothetical protein